MTAFADHMLVFRCEVSKHKSSLGKTFAQFPAHGFALVTRATSLDNRVKQSDHSYYSLIIINKSLVCQLVDPLIT